MIQPMVCALVWSAAVAGPSTPPDAARPVAAIRHPAPLTRQAQAQGPVFVRIETNFGDIDLELDAARAPLSVANFLRYVDEGFYEGTLFHRAVPNFLIQAGGYTTASLIPRTEGLHEPVRNEWNNGLKNLRMTVGAARVHGKPHSATSEFYINLVDNPRLDRAQDDGTGYAVFGRVIKGETVVETMSKVKCFVHSRYREPSGRAVTPTQPITIKAVHRIDENGQIIEPGPDPTQLEPPAIEEDVAPEGPEAESEAVADDQPPVTRPGAIPQRPIRRPGRPAEGQPEDQIPPPAVEESPDEASEDPAAEDEGLEDEDAEAQDADSEDGEGEAAEVEATQDEDADMEQAESEENE